MKKFLILASFLATALARPDGLLDGNDGHVSVTQSSLGTYKYTVHLKDSFRSEERLADGTIFGEYTIPDANGHPVVIKYSSGHDGFRILEGLPMAPLDPTIPLVVNVVPIVDENVEILASRSGLVAPTTELKGAFSPVAVPSLEHVVSTPVEYTPEVKAAREAFFAAHNAALATA